MNPYTADSRLFVVLIADIVGSRQLSDRAATQRDLLETIDGINRVANLAVPLAITSGDECQGLFEQWPAVVEVLAGLSDALFPQGFYFGVGVGPLSTAMRPEIGSMDGPCFH